MKWYSDFVFWNRSNNNILAIDNIAEGTERDFAQKLARKHQVTVSYAKVEEYFVEPDRCGECGEILPESGPCWHNRFEEEEATRPTRAEVMAREAEIRAKVTLELYGKEVTGARNQQ